ncbi:MAG TPA: ribosome biogenesis GTPase YlqF [Polyangiaceae bacterium]|nr:ribosome biogenesis GTPase YlqF [Polyangiaceae bacterium]
MAIDWYPGHMVTARKEAAIAMRKTDVVIEVLDARVPFSSRNPVIEELRKQNQRAALKILNKSDMADPERTKLWLAHYNAQPGVKAVALSAKQAKAVRRIPEYAKALAPTRNSPLKPLRMMILGIPNVGKSTLMNALLQRVVTKVGDEPAVTKMHHRHELGKGMWLTDTPGMMWPGIGNDVGLKLAATHSIGRNAYDNTEVAASLGAYLLEQYPALLSQRFGSLAETLDGHGLLEAIAQSRGFIVKGGALDLERAARIFLGEFRDGTLGPITLEIPEDVEAPPRISESP